MPPLLSSPKKTVFLVHLLPVVLLLVMVATTNAFGVLPVSTHRELTTTSAKSPSSALFAFKKKNSASSALAEEALDCFPFQFLPEKAELRRLTDTTRSKALQAFNEMSRLYGEDRALKMVKIQPSVLCQRTENFGPSFEIWTDIFGLENAQKMVERNPALLLVSPKLAADSSDATMTFSYVIWATRPLPKLAAVGGLLAILSGGLFQQ